MKVPMLTETPKIETPLQNPLQVKAPAVPDPVPGSFGENIAKATERLGQETMTSAERLERMNEYKAQAHAYDVIGNFGQVIDDKQYSEEPKPMTTPDGQPIYDADHNEIMVPTGYLNRKLGQAEHSLDNYRAEIIPVRDQFLNQIQHPIARKMAERYMNNMIRSADRLIAKNQSTQYRETINSGYNSNIANGINRMAGVADPTELNDNLGLILETYDKKAAFNGTDSDTAIKDKSKIVGDAAYTAAKSILDNTRDYTKAQDIIDSQKDNMLPGTYNTVTEKLDLHSAVLGKRDAHVALQTKIDNRFSFFDAVAQGKEDLNNPSESILANATRDPELAEAISRVSKAGEGGYAAEDENFADVVKTVSEAKDQNTLSQYILQALRDNPKMGADKLAVLTSYAKQKAKSLAVSTEHPVAQDPTVPNSIQKAIDSGLNAVMGWAQRTGGPMASIMTNYLASTDKGTPPQDAVKTVIKDQVKVDHPETNLLDDTPHAVMNMRNGVQNVWDGNTTQQANYKIENNQIVPKQSKAALSVGSIIQGQGRFAGKTFRVTGIDDNGKAKVKEITNAGQ